METKKNAGESAAAEEPQKIKWNDEALRSSYANVVNVVGGREEISLLFGQSRTWKPAQKDVVVDLNQKMVLSPSSAKRLAFLLGGALRAYEKAFGVIELGLKEDASSPKK